jgi:hypothetical protein
MMGSHKMLNYLLSISILIFVIGCSRSAKEAKQTGIDANNIAFRSSDSTFVFHDFHLAIDAPYNWKSEELNENMFVFKMDCDTGRVFCPNLVARFIPLEKQLTLEDCAELFLSSFQAKFENFELVSSLDKEVGKFKIKVVDYKMFENGTNLGGTTAFVILEDKTHAFALSIMAENDTNGSYINYRRLFENILKSLKPA